jgi:hypothetical protein
MNHDRSRPREAELAIVAELIDEHVGFDCTLIQLDAQTWAIHGSIAVDGESILAEFSTQAEAEAALEQLAGAATDGTARSRGSLGS